MASCQFQAWRLEIPMRITVSKGRKGRRGIQAMLNDRFWLSNARPVELSLVIKDDQALLQPGGYILILRSRNHDHTQG